MFAIVKRHLRPVVYLLVLAQLLLSAPVVNAMAGIADTSHASSTCAGHMPEGPGHGGECPCCPDGVTTMAGCLAACIAAVAPVQSFAPLRIASLATLPDDPIAVVLGAIADPPLKPPPIR